MLGSFSSSVLMGPAQRRLCRNGVPVFAYHKIAAAPRETLDPFLFIGPEGFAKQLGALLEAGCVSATLADIVTAKDNAGRRVVISFDDGCSSVSENGLEPLARHGFRAIQFLVAGRIGGRNEWDIAKGDVPAKLMDEAQIREWLDAGHEIGSHSMTHGNLRRISMADAREEIFASKKLLEDRFGRVVEHFSYPYGAWTEAVRDLVREAGYRTACTMAFGVNVSSTPCFELRRIIPLSSRELRAKIRHRLARKIAGGK